ncbi:hypothetical conserved protein [Oceanobacillus iheyensis HTE831]|uniref:Hypothetical conserved protein n=1 Tax=Oceanobacillus iheyensis (strain DSM 14371 / CIP 107618 / JCM 11309 / KCTC 3954 / HTE831) TaxID=221109 RepID=Q8ES55_OCEIH|nr:ASCH domain-containing protein [Oceanobacillus iheyensis]BAC12744.1 hypothetical conserved protein [Oceanobacillus iheyensis HTE831]
MNEQSVKDIWNAFTKIQRNAPNFDEVDVWAFGDAPDHADGLAKLVLEGKKTATSSSYRNYLADGDSLPERGLHNIILNSYGEAVAIIVTTDVEIVPYHEVTEEHAYLEGEGDLSLHYWQEVHEAFFSRELKRIGEEFSGEIPVVCERFELVYKSKSN